jgi:apolipoprotein N-acyltransferase
MSPFRAVESGAYLARAATTGFSAIFDPHGRAVAAASLGERRVVVGEVQRRPAVTLDQRVGAVVGWGSALAVTLLLALGRGTLSRKKNAGSPLFSVRGV